MTLLVVGADRVDAGKTTFSTGLVAKTSAVGFKPRAGNDYWFHHDDYREAVSAGGLYGKDARRLAAASPGSLGPTDINPIHRLWRPDPGNGNGLLGQEGRQFVLDRVGEQYIVNADAEIPEGCQENLPLDDAIAVESVEQLNHLTSEYHMQALAELSQTIERTDRAVVESYGNVARPIQGIDPDAVAVVEPGKVRIVDGSRFLQCCQIATGSEGAVHGQLEERVSSVLDLLDPEAVLSLPALDSERRKSTESVATAYEPAYQKLIKTAGW